MNLLYEEINNIISNYFNVLNRFILIYIETYFHKGLTLIKNYLITLNGRRFCKVKESMANI